MQSILSLIKTNKLILATFAFLAVLALGSGRAHAATVNVSGSCTLSLAITSVNNGSADSNCISNSTGSYGTNDTITIPAGTTTINSDSPYITKSVKIQGAGMSQTTLSGNAGQYRTIRINDATATVTIQNLKIVSYLGQGIISNNGSVNVSNVEVDGTNALPTGNQLKGIELGNSAAANVSATVNNVYIHDLDAAASNGVYGFNISTAIATINNTTVANINNSNGDAGAFLILLVGAGTINADVTNTTVNKITASGAAYGFGALGGGLTNDATVHVTVKNSTIAELDGSTGSVGQPSIAFFTGAAAASPHTASVIIDAQNSLLTNNKSDGVASNCGAVNANAAFGGLTGTVTSVINSDGHNLSDDGTCTTFTETGDQQNLSNLFSTLGPLQDNGGPVPTMALLAGSPAINAGGAVLGITTDARGVARNACPSVGAFQFEGAVCAASTTSGGGSNAGAPNTGIGSAPLLALVFAAIFGTASLGYALKRK